MTEKVATERFMREAGYGLSLIGLQNADSSSMG